MAASGTCCAVRCLLYLGVLIDREYGRGSPIALADITVHGYPQLPAINLQHRSPYGWWDQQERKNFDEVVSIICWRAKSGSVEGADRSSA